FTVLTGIAYPLGMTGVAQVLFPAQANGSLIQAKDGAVIGSALIGQSFTGESYFHGRPSATSTPYRAPNSHRTNRGPPSKALADRIREETDKLKAENPDAPVPVDLVTTSASGLDPDISPEAAAFQVPRVAKARGVTESSLYKLVLAHTEERLLG